MKEIKKHAYCIIAHNEPEVLKTLVTLIDDIRNDIFLMVDKKTDISIFEGIKPQYSRLFLAPRIDIRWGGQSQIKAELEIFGCAVKNGPYKIYHLLSGVDLPIKSQDYIHTFIEEHPNTEFVGFAKGDSNKEDLRFKTQYYHFFMPFVKHKNKKLRMLGNRLSHYSLELQKRLKVKRKYDLELKKGSNWVSITHPFCQYLLAQKKYILRTFKYMSCADEIYKQSLLWNSSFCILDH